MKVQRHFIVGMCILATTLPVHAELLLWKANTGGKFGSKISITETVKALDREMTKPAAESEIEILQQTAATNRSTIPYIKGIPTFPLNSISIGDSWKEQATLSYSLSAFSLEKSEDLEVEVAYKLEGLAEIDNRKYYRITAEWKPFLLLDRKTAKATGVERIAGHSSMEIYWDAVSGGPKQSTLIEEIQYRFTDGTSVYYLRTTNEDFKTVTEIVREQVIKELNEQIAAAKVEDVEVKQSDQGIVLSIDNIQFQAESAILTDSEKAKLATVGGLLASLTSRKLKVVGHAANPPGSDEAELIDLSSRRAKSVADYLVETGVKTPDMIVSLGMGGSVPIDTNETPEGRSKNRRVEIVIMDEQLDPESDLFSEAPGTTPADSPEPAGAPEPAETTPPAGAVNPATTPDTLEAVQ